MAKPSVPDSITEEYYQISDAILSSFPKYRLPLDMFVFDDNIGQLITFSVKNSRLSNEQVDQLQQLCAHGDLFVSRTDHPIYSKHLIKQLDLVLLDQNLKEAEVADICINALIYRLENFFEQPVKVVLDALYVDTNVVTEFIWQDKHRIKLFMRRLFKRSDHTLANHSVNSCIVGLWLLLQTKKDKELSRKDFNAAAFGLLTHDIGMTKVPAFILGKTTPLKPDERDKLVMHPLAGYKVMQKFEQTSDLVKQALLEHHERLDGSGYPQHAKEISFFGKLTAVADSFSAMIQKRPYSEAKDCLTAAKELATAKQQYDTVFTHQLLVAFANGGDFHEKL